MNFQNFASSDVITLLNLLSLYFLKISKVSVSAFLVFQPDFGQACLILFGWSVVYFVAGAHILLLIGVAAATIGLGSFAYNYSEHFARRIDFIYRKQLVQSRYPIPRLEHS